MREYAPGSPERAELQARLEEMKSGRLELPCFIGSEEVKTGNTFEAVMPHDKGHVLATVHKGGPAEVEQAINASAEAWEDWHRLPWEERAAVFLRAAELLAGPWRSTLVAATMLNQSKTAYQAEIDAACEVIDFWRFNVQFMLRIYEEQPVSSPGVWNRMECAEISDVALASEHLAGVHFTGSTAVFHSIWKTVGQNIDRYRNYPRIVGETGGKDFIMAHPSADVEAVATAILRGSFEYQGQKCSAASRVYAPANLWPELRERLVEEVGTIKMGDVSDFSNFMGAVIDAKAHKGHREALEEARSTPDTEIVVGGGADDSEGFFIEPTVIETRDPRMRLMRDELFGPIVTAYVYPERQWEETLRLVDETAPYALTGAIFSGERAPIDEAEEALRYAAGNFYVNDKPTGAVVGQQPFGGARASGTNDKAGSMWNLIRWVSPRTIKETFVPPRDYRYPFLGPEDGAGSTPSDRP